MSLALGSCTAKRSMRWQVSRRSWLSEAIPTVRPMVLAVVNMLMARGEGEEIVIWLLHVPRADPSVLRGRAWWTAPRSGRSCPSLMGPCAAAARRATLVRAGSAGTLRLSRIYDLGPATWWRMRMGTAGS